MNGSPDQPRPESETGIVIVVYRDEMFRLVTSRLRLINQEGPGYQCFRLLAKTVKMFLKHASSPSTSTDEMKAVLCDVFPSTLSASLMGVLPRPAVEESEVLEGSDRAERRILK